MTTRIFRFRPPDEPGSDWSRNPVAEPIRRRLVRVGFPQFAVREDEALDPHIPSADGSTLAGTTLEGPA